MASPHQFGIVRRPLTARQVTQRRRIAERHGCEFIYVGRNGIPGSDVVGWFTCANQGEPFNTANSRAVLAEVQS